MPESVQPESVMADPALVESIAERGARIRARIAELTDRHVTIVAVTKGHPPEVAAAALAAGFVDLGESYAQELLPKAAALGAAPAGTALAAGPRWHFIGRLQSNKVRAVADVVHLWHTVDRASLAAEVAIGRRAPRSWSRSIWPGCPGGEDARRRAWIRSWPGVTIWDSTCGG